ncbi:MAG: DUF2179 domain-containing protein [Bacilli bacterium]|nr:DUF2179 domain-containing protein [Bacilli bacterium]
MLILCLKIFFTRIIDVSLGTFRTIVLVKGKNVLAGCIGFFEVLVWFVIVREALNTDYMGLWIAIFYSFGFACGTIIGAYLTSYFISFPISLQIITTNNNLAFILRKKGYGVSSVKIEGKEGWKNMLILETVEKRYKEIMRLIKAVDKDAFVVVNETKYIHNGFLIRK